MADWLPELTDDDLDTLVDALETWESKGLSGEIMSDLMGAVIGRDDTMRAEIEKHQREEKVKRDRERSVRKERSVILRAKILTLRDRRRVDRAIGQPDASTR